MLSVHNPNAFQISRGTNQCRVVSFYVSHDDVPLFLLRPCESFDICKRNAARVSWNVCQRSEGDLWNYYERLLRGMPVD